jgi:3D (Asp-Asp-Asp) domain-containing protein
MSTMLLKLLMALAALNFTMTGIELYLLFRRQHSWVKIIFNVVCGICAILLSFFYVNELLDQYESNKKIKIQVDSVQIKEIPFHKLKATYYNPTSGQCDATPLVTGSGYKINLDKLKRKEIKVVAVSRDLLKQYPYGSTIYVHQPVHLRGTYRVEDTMNKRFTNRVDFLVYDKIAVDSIHISI